jgi:mannosyl-oligosaccharide glucosidase
VPEETVKAVAGGFVEQCKSGALTEAHDVLALGALKHYSLQPGPEQNRCTQLYHALRANVLKTVLGEYHRTGFLWEQFDDKEGVGIRGHPFSGWTALVVNIMAERY